ncbi:MAG TPA: hypothetical protein VL093_01845 [Flavipsychrobacter sp.]|nr:hypothetical protein [Flavipsychrobacter sp.]
MEEKYFLKVDVLQGQMDGLKFPFHHGEIKTMKQKEKDSIVTHVIAAYGMIFYSAESIKMIEYLIEKDSIAFSKNVDADKTSFFRFEQRVHMDSVILNLNKLLRKKKESFSLFQLLNKLENNARRLPDISLTETRMWMQGLLEQESFIKHVMNIRDQYVAHNDRNKRLEITASLGQFLIHAASLLLKMFEWLQSVHQRLTSIELTPIMFSPIKSFHYLMGDTISHDELPLAKVLSPISRPS